MRARRRAGRRRSAARANAHIAHAKGPQVQAGEFHKQPTVFATFVEHAPNMHPPGATGDRADLVRYANGQLALSADKQQLTGEMKLWRNVLTPPPAFGHQTPPDAFDDADAGQTIEVTVAQSGQATFQRKAGGLPIDAHPPHAMNATFDHAIYVEKAPSGMRSLSFTLGYTIV